MSFTDHYVISKRKTTGDPIDDGTLNMVDVSYPFFRQLSTWKNEMVMMMMMMDVVLKCWGNTRSIKA